ncbi:MAG: M48 family metalloprotease [Candidatus Bathyarchaeia archaeon]
MKSGKIIITNESWFQLITIFLTIGAYVFFPVLFPPPLLNIVSEITHDVPLITHLIEWSLWVNWAAHVSFLVVVFILIFVSPNLILRKHKATLIIDGELFETVQSLSNKLGLMQPPKILLEKSKTAFCFVFGTFFQKNNILVSSSLLDNLERNEVEAVLLHELSHIKNKDVVIGTWADYLKVAMKYYFPFIFALTIFYSTMGLYYVYPTGIFDYAISLVNISITFAILLLITNYALRTREFLADARVLSFNNYEDSLKSAMAKIALINSDEKLKVLSESKQRSKASLDFLYAVLGYLPPSITVTISRLIAPYPTIKDRTSAINSRKYLVFEGEIKLPSKGTLAIFGLLASYVQVIGLVVSAVPIYIGYYLTNADPTFLLLCQLFGFFLFFLAPSIVIFFPLYQYMKNWSGQYLDKERYGGLKIMPTVFKAIGISILFYFVAYFFPFKGADFESIKSVIILSTVYFLVAALLSVVYLLKLSLIKR